MTFTGNDTDLIMFGQLVLAIILGILIGAERSIAGKTAGMRTYALVTMGACLFILVSNVIIARFTGLSTFDPLRVAAGIVTGIGFLGAGIIIFRETTLQGLTTAAGLWVAAGIGIAVGYKLYLLAVLATLLTLFVFTFLWFVEEYIENRIRLFPAKKRPVVVDEEDPTPQ